jgi:hypothetical protein
MGTHGAMSGACGTALTAARDVHARPRVVRGRRRAAGDGTAPGEGRGLAIARVTNARPGVQIAGSRDLRSRDTNDCCD